MRRCTTSAAALLVLLAGCGSGEHSEPPGADSSLPTTTTSDIGRAVGPPPEIPWWSAGKLHVPEGILRTPMRQIVSRGGTTIVGRATQHGSTWMIVRGHALTELVSTRSLGVRPVLSANGRYAAWTTSVVTHRDNDLEADAEFTVTAYDVGRGAESGSTVLDSHTACCDGDGVVAVAGVDNDGSVLIARYADRAWVWRPGRPPVQIAGEMRPDRLPGNDQWPGGVSWTSGNSSDDPAVLGRVPQAQGGLWSPDGTAYAYAPAVKGRSVRPVVWRDGHRQPLHAPHGAWPVAWESERRVLLVATGDPDARRVRVVRCWVVDGRCEQAGPPLRHAQLPDPFVF
jgi:hypothetical protein